MEKTVLVVEDEPLVRRVVGRRLEKEGFRVLEAENGRDALDRYSESAKDIDLLLTDVLMPEMDGCDLSRRIAALHQGIKVVYMSASPEGVLAKDGIVEGRLRFLAKPFTQTDLKVTVALAMTDEPPPLVCKRADCD